jgi:hypothetical protein
MGICCYLPDPQANNCPAEASNSQPGKLEKVVRPERFELPTYWS